MKIKTNIYGMSCQSCVTKIKTKLEELKGIDKVDIDLNKELAIIEYDPNTTNEVIIKAKIKELGYNTTKEESGVKSGLIAALIPHTGCIAFIIGSIFGTSLLIKFFRPWLMSANFFYGLIGLSFLFATISATFYLKKNQLLTIKGMKKKWQYLSVMYGTTIGINLLLFFVIFPMLANASVSNNSINDNIQSDTIKLDVNIPCSGHALLITEDLKTLDGIIDIKYDYNHGHIFSVTFDKTKQNIDGITALEVFKTYPATVIDAGSKDSLITQTSNLVSESTTSSTCTPSCIKSRSSENIPTSTCNAASTCEGLQ